MRDLVYEHKQLKAALEAKDKEIERLTANLEAGANSYKRMKAERDALRRAHD